MSNSFTPSSVPVGAPFATRVSHPARGLSHVDRQTEDEVFLLPGGYVDESGNIHDDVQFSPWTGLDEYLLASLAPGTCTATVITHVLASCVKRIGSLEHVDESVVRQLLVADRDYLIVKLRSLTLGRRVDCVLRCPDAECAELMDLTLDLDDLEFERKPVTQRYLNFQRKVGTGQRESEQLAGAVEFRFPNGADQEVCAPLFAFDKEAAVTELLSRCIRRVDTVLEVDGAAVSLLGDAERLEIEEVMSQMAPRSDIELEASCLKCGKSLDASFDALPIFLEEITGSFRNIERDVHFLAWHYHWTEHEILSMTQQKRRRYVALLQEEVDRLNQVW